MEASRWSPRGNGRFRLHLYPAPAFRYRRLDCASFGRPPRLEESATVPDDPKMRAAAAHLFEVTTW